MRAHALALDPRATTPATAPAHAPRAPLAVVRATAAPTAALRAAATSAASTPPPPARPADAAPSGAAVDLWFELVAGRWCVVDQFEHGGRRYLVVRKAPLPELAALTERERQVAEYVARGCANKYVAIELALRESTVATHLKNALKKLGLRSRVELVNLSALARATRPAASMT